MGLVRGGAGASIITTSLPKPLSSPHSVPVASTLIEILEPREKVTVPSDYGAFKDVFNKQETIQLLHHWPWDCAMDLLPGAKLPKGRVYPLSIPFITSSGPYEYLVMPYGLAKSVFRGFMNEVFQEFLHRFVIVYIDDLLIYSRNLDDHRQHVTQVLQ